MTNVNIELPEELHKKLKVVCALDSITIKEYIVKTLEEKLKKRDV